MRKTGNYIGQTRGPIIALAFITGLLGWIVTGWWPWSLLISLFRGREQSIIWGTILSMPIPVVATTIIVSLRLLQGGQEEARGQRIGAQPRALAREGQTAARLALAQQIEEQRVREQQARAQQPRVPQPEAQQLGAQQPGAQQPEAQQPGAQQPGVQQPEAQQPGMQQPGAQQAPEQQMQQDQVIQVQDLLGQMQDRLLRLQAQMPEMQQAPIAQLLEELRQVQGNASQMTASEIQERMRQLQERMGRMQSVLPEGSLPPEAQAELARVQQQMAQMMAQVMTQTVVQMQQAAVQPPAVLQPEELLDEDETELDLGDLDLGAEDLSDLFDVEEVEDQYAAALKDGLEEIDMLDLLEECKKVASQLREGNSLVSRVIREQSREEAKL